MQRAGRSGHRPGETSRILCVPTHAWELVEIAAAREATAARQIEARRPLRCALDVLIQHIATLAAGPGVAEEVLLREVRDTHAYADLTDSEWQWALDFVTRGGTALQGYPQFRRVVRMDGLLQVLDKTTARRHRMAIGTISSNTEMQIKWMNGTRLGTVEEAFIGRLEPGDDFVFAGRVLRLVQVKDMAAYVRLSKAKRTQVPRWQGGRLPLSVELADAVLDVLGRPERWPTHPELIAAKPLLDIQSAWSALPTARTLLVERFHTREGFHLFAYPFCGRLANEGIATLVAARWARERPQTFSVSANDYGFELLSPSEIVADESRLQSALSAASLAEDLLAGVNLGELSRRQFRDIARIAGLVFQGFPGRGKNTRQLQASSGLVFDVLARYDPENLLLRQSRLEVLEAQLELARISSALERICGRRIVMTHPRRLTPLSFPLWATRLQSQTLSTESWQTRIERAARELEAYATRAA
jgi:ATP-dependent Lhr-like helicase